MNLLPLLEAEANIIFLVLGCYVRIKYKRFFGFLYFKLMKIDDYWNVMSAHEDVIYCIDLLTNLVGKIKH